MYILPPAAAAGFGIIDAVIIRVEAAGCLNAEAAAAAAAAVASLSVATGDSSLMEKEESTLAAAEEEGRSMETCRFVRGFQLLIVYYFSSLLAVGTNNRGHSTPELFLDSPNSNLNYSRCRFGEPR